MPFFDYSPPKYIGPSIEQIKALRQAHVSPASFMMYKDPIMIVDAKMQWCYDQTGYRYLDFLGGVNTIGVGHCHPRITAAIKEQLDRVQHLTTIYLND